MSIKSLRTIAIYLPQFHPIPENNKWWGNGFTEWTNVTKAKPLFEGHYQPHIPADLGFYDLRLKESRLSQEFYAKMHGISGFCYYHYWFSGKKILNQPLDLKLQNKEENLPFMICWANENWTRSWDGLNTNVLLEQNYSLSDDINHFEEFNRFFEDPRYITIDGKPVLLIYRTNLFPNIHQTVEIWRNAANKKGYKGLYLVNVQGIGSNCAPEDIGFDANMVFQPDFTFQLQRRLPKFWDRVLNKLNVQRAPEFENAIFEYSDLVNSMINRQLPSYTYYPSVCPSWDNTSRRAKGRTIFSGSTPQLYEKWLDKTIERFEPKSKEENLVFINAWNEWAEGNHLEPCLRWGKQYLEVTGKVLEKWSR